MKKPLAYSYIRFSHPDQAKGDSMRRQTELRDAWLARNHATLDTSVTLEDRGVPGYTGAHRGNPDRHALAAFVALVNSGRIAQGSYLIVENLDRLSREDIIPALSLLLDLIQAGIRVVQLLPVETVYEAKSNPMHLMMAIMELSRGHSESAMKSERVGGAWAEKKRRARQGEGQRATARMGEGCHVLTHKLPAWIRERGGRLELIPARAAVVKHIYALAARGYGHRAIVNALCADNIEPFGKKVVALREGDILREDG